LELSDGTGHYQMLLAILTAVPFLLAILLATPIAQQTLNKSIQTYLTASVIGMLFLIFLSYIPQLHDQPYILESVDWIPSLGITLSFYLDGLSLMFALIITGIGALIFFYAGHYFDEAEEHNRFIIWLLSFAGAMLGVVLSGNLLMMFVAWELTSITSFMLIGFKGDKYEDARAGAFQALFVTGGGALSLIIGIVLMGVAAGQILYPDTTTVYLITNIDELLKVKTLYQHEWFPAFTILIAIGAFTKSAQFPFHFWLPGAMSAPTPASAYLHSATMVKAGIFLLARLSPIMYKNELWSLLLLTAGLSTMFIGAFWAIKQRDLKGLLAYSTISKLGAIVAMIGLPGQNGLKAAFVGIMAHALYKSALFLVAGTIDHATGTRIIDKLGGLRKQMPAMFIVTIISALSMAGVPFLFGFLAKETLLDAMYHYPTYATTPVIAIVLVSSVFTALAGYMLIYDVFWKESTEEIHFHKPPNLIRVAPLALSLGSLTLGVLLEPVIMPILELAVPKEFELHLFVGINDIFIMSVGVLISGLVLFGIRTQIIQLMQFPFVSGNRVYREIIMYIEWAGDSVLRTQSGYVRYYLVIILGTVAGLLIMSGTLQTVTTGASIFPRSLAMTTTELSEVFLLFLTVVAAVLTVIVKEHIKAAIAFGVIGYAIGTIFLLDHAPDVALVQLLVETMATVLIIIMLGRINPKTRKEAMGKLWHGRHEYNFGLLRDLGISIVIGLAVFVFALSALQNQPKQESIAEWHLANTASLGTQDVVGAIVSDFRATDTLLEIAVFATAGLGVLTLLARGRQDESPLVPLPDSIKRFAEFAPDIADRVQDATNLSTPFTQSVSYIVLPIAILIGIAQILYGGNGSGDGFTAGVTIALAIALWYVVFGYAEAKNQLRWFRPERFVRLGLLLAIFNGLMPILFGKGFMGHVEIDKMIGLYDIIKPLGLHVTTALMFEIAIAITVMGGFGMITEAIAHPTEVQKLDEEDLLS
jgi:NADH:ubiquinone oxidoreductase subunit 5 (subunit L)/multisubunit Na+/H+ antiporter MnhA subunit/uncharacterized MnhB-related membrane protein